MTEDSATSVVSVVYCKNLDELRSYATHRKAHSIYRGQRDAGWKLISPWDRQIEWMQSALDGRPVESAFAPGTYEANIKQYLHDFRESLECYGSGTDHLKCDDDWWAYGRHFDLLTPLLDWTYDHDVAVFFAAVGVIEQYVKDEKDGSKKTLGDYPNFGVWALDCSMNPFEDKMFTKVETNAGHRTRQKAQKGLFTKLSDGIHFDVESFLGSHGRFNALSRYELCSQTAEKVVRALFDQGIHYASLFPDAWGAAKYANMMPYTSPRSSDDLKGKS